MIDANLYRTILCTRWAVFLAKYWFSKPMAPALIYTLRDRVPQRLTFLPGLLRGFGISANYGYTASDSRQRARAFPTIRSYSARRRMPGMFSPTYDVGVFSSRLGISHNDANIWSYGSKMECRLAEPAQR